MALVVLGGVKSRFPETQEYIDNTLKECVKEKMTADDVTFLQVQKQRISLEKLFLF